MFSLRCVNPNATDANHTNPNEYMKKNDIDQLLDLAEIRAYKARFDAAHQHLLVRCGDLEQLEGRVEKLKHQCHAQKDTVDLDNGGAVMKLATAEKQLSLSTDRLMKLGDAVSPAMEAIRNVMNDFQDIYYRTVKPLYLAVELEVAEAVMP